MSSSNSKSRMNGKMGGELKDVVYQYPKSSCPCYGCNERVYTPNPDTTPSNIGVSGCQIPPVLECTNRMLIGESVEPSVTPAQALQSTNINPQSMSVKYNPNFLVCNDSCAQPYAQSGCPNPTYVNSDPRLFSASHVQYLHLDRPPVDSNVRMKDVYNESLRGYGQGYRTYSDIKAGDVMYYTTPTFQQAFYEPVYTPGKTTSTLYKDPMGNVRPEYDWCGGPQQNPVDRSDCDYGMCGLSFLDDTMKFRNEIISLQQRSYNETRWSPRWG